MVKIGSVKLGELLQAQKKLGLDQEDQDVKTTITREPVARTEKQKPGETKIKVIRTIPKSGQTTKIEINTIWDQSDITGMRRYLSQMGFYDGESALKRFMLWVKGY